MNSPFSEAGRVGAPAEYLINWDNHTVDGRDINLGQSMVQAGGAEVYRIDSASGDLAAAETGSASYTGVDGAAQNFTLPLEPPMSLPHVENLSAKELRAAIISLTQTGEATQTGWADGLPDFNLNFLMTLTWTEPESAGSSKKFQTALAWSFDLDSSSEVNACEITPSSTLTLEAGCEEVALNEFFERIDACEFERQSLSQHDNNLKIKIKVAQGCLGCQPEGEEPPKEVSRVETPSPAPKKTRRNGVFRSSCAAALALLVGLSPNTVTPAESHRLNIDIAPAWSTSQTWHNSSGVRGQVGGTCHARTLSEALNAGSVGLACEGVDPVHLEKVIRAMNHFVLSSNGSPDSEINSQYGSFFDAGGPVGAVNQPERLFGRPGASALGVCHPEVAEKWRLDRETGAPPPEQLLRALEKTKDRGAKDLIADGGWQKLAESCGCLVSAWLSLKCDQNFEQTNPETGGRETCLDHVMDSYARTCVEVRNARHSDKSFLCDSGTGESGLILRIGIDANPTSPSGLTPLGLGPETPTPMGPMKTLLLKPEFLSSRRHAKGRSHSVTPERRRSGDESGILTACEVDPSSPECVTAYENLLTKPLREGREWKSNLSPDEIEARVKRDTGNHASHVVYFVGKMETGDGSVYGISQNSWGKYKRNKESGLKEGLREQGGFFISNIQDFNFFVNWMRNSQFDVYRVCDGSSITSCLPSKASDLILRGLSDMHRLRRRQDDEEPDSFAHFNAFDTVDLGRMVGFGYCVRGICSSELDGFRKVLNGRCAPGAPAPGSPAPAPLKRLLPAILSSKFQTSSDAAGITATSYGHSRLSTALFFPSPEKHLLFLQSLEWGVGVQSDRSAAEFFIGAEVSQATAEIVNGEVLPRLRERIAKLSESRSDVGQRLRFVEAVHAFVLNLFEQGRRVILSFPISEYEAWRQRIEAMISKENSEDTRTPLYVVTPRVAPGQSVQYSLGLIVPAEVKLRELEEKERLTPLTTAQREDREAARKKVEMARMKAEMADDGLREWGYYYY